MSKVYTTRVFWDVENLLPGLQHNGQDLLTELKSKIESVIGCGVLTPNQFDVEVIANFTRESRDFRPQRNVKDLQYLSRELFQAGATLIHVPERKANAADLCMTKHMHKAMRDLEGTPSVFVVVSGDSDFKDVIQAALSEGFRVVLVHNAQARSTYVDCGRGSGNFYRIRFDDILDALPIICYRCERRFKKPAEFRFHKSASVEVSEPDIRDFEWGGDVTKRRFLAELAKISVESPRFVDQGHRTFLEFENQDHANYFFQSARRVANDPNSPLYGFRIDPEFANFFGQNVKRPAGMYKPISKPKKINNLNMSADPFLSTSTTTNITTTTNSTVNGTNNKKKNSSTRITDADRLSDEELLRIMASSAPNSRHSSPMRELTNGDKDVNRPSDMGLMNLLTGNTKHGGSRGSGKDNNRGNHLSLSPPRNSGRSRLQHPPNLKFAGGRPPLSPPIIPNGNGFKSNKTLIRRNPNLAPWKCYCCGTIHDKDDLDRLITGYKCITCEASFAPLVQLWNLIKNGETENTVNACLDFVEEKEDGTKEGVNWRMIARMLCTFPPEDVHKVTCLHLICAKNRHQILTALCSFMIDQSEEFANAACAIEYDFEGNTPLGLAVKKGSEKIITILLDMAPALLLVRDEKKEYPFQLKVDKPIYAFIDTIRNLDGRGTDDDVAILFNLSKAAIEICDEPMIHFMMDLENTKKFLDMKVSVAGVAGSSVNLLQWTMDQYSSKLSQNDFLLFELIWKNKPELLVESCEGHVNTPLHFLCSNTQQMRLSAEFMARLAIVVPPKMWGFNGRVGRSPFVMLIQGGEMNEGAIGTLLNCGFDKEQIGSFINNRIDESPKSSPLQLALQQLDVKIASLIVRHLSSEQIVSVDELGFTCLHTASTLGLEDFVTSEWKYLKFAANKQNNDSQFPFSLAQTESLEGFLAAKMFENEDENQQTMHVIENPVEAANNTHMPTMDMPMDIPMDFMGINMDVNSMNVNDFNRIENSEVVADFPIINNSISEVELSNQKENIEEEDTNNDQEMPSEDEHATTSNMDTDCPAIEFVDNEDPVADEIHTNGEEVNLDVQVLNEVANVSNEQQKMVTEEVKYNNNHGDVKDDEDDDDYWFAGAENANILEAGFVDDDDATCNNNNNSKENSTTPPAIEDLMDPDFRSLLNSTLEENTDINLKRSVSRGEKIALTRIFNSKK
eukprot:TRINITY_DN3895_c0_g1_i3.p1 TRINITY_DN3895_c0_g1~~TRINITY_DN3895_c0_g1_i3.p1  ORF type:complete len:1189 (-),score=332.47 TRINITY_DN3895_c0_g1_i3:562-4128(-)